MCVISSVSGRECVSVWEVCVLVGGCVSVSSSIVGTWEIKVYKYKYLLKLITNYKERVRWTDIMWKPREQQDTEKTFH